MKGSETMLYLLKNPLKSYTEKIDKNIYEISVNFDRIFEFFKYHKCEIHFDKFNCDWRICGNNISDVSGKNMVYVNPFNYKIFGNKHLRQYVSCFNFDKFDDTLFIKYKVVSASLFGKTLIEILSIRYSGIEVECVNNMPQYWNYPDRFKLLKSFGNIPYSDDKSVADMYWTDNGNGLYSGYLELSEYDNFKYRAYDLVDGYIVFKNQNFHYGDVRIFKKGITSISSKDILFHFDYQLGKGKVFNLLKKQTEYDFGFFTSVSQNKYVENGIFEILNNTPFSEFENIYRVPQEFNYIKVTLKKGIYDFQIIDDSFSEDSLKIMSDREILSEADSGSPAFIGLYPVEIEFYDKYLYPVCKLEFDRFGVGKFIGFKKVK